MEKSCIFTFNPVRRFVEIKARSQIDAETAYRPGKAQGKIIEKKI
jgi:hypothetical protein